MTAAVRDDPLRRYPDYDFSRPAQLGREHRRRLEAAFEAFARQWASQLTGKVRMRTHLTLEGVELMSYQEYADTLPTTTAMVTGATAGREEPGAVQFDLGVALAWVVQMLGGRSTAPIEPRTLTPIESALIRQLMDRTFELLTTSLGMLLPSPLTYAGLHDNPQYLQVISPGEAVIVARFAMRMGESRSTATVMLPAAVVVDQLAESERHAASAHRAGATVDQVLGTPLEVSLRIAPRVIAAGEVLNLAPGDLLRFAHPETKPFDLIVGDTPIARAVPGAQGSRLACTITTILEETTR
ncbi:flagellar motor switch protein FliM [uncultured Microbacterium sp.]|uniref:flagellar motor switch protein FliM n=1 Tax=uncultured Microbacterium sp. TaxID=191216 RepID=UPI0025E24130|nr:flagellar motor switch protein FliM [uncultured Microbacterium sp.]